MLLVDAEYLWACKGLHAGSLELSQLRAASGTLLIGNFGGMCRAQECQQQAGLSTLRGIDAHPRLAISVMSDGPRHGMLAPTGPHCIQRRIASVKLHNAD